MCTHLDKTGATYYFRRLVPVDLIGCFTTATGKPRTEWKRSLRTKDKEEAKRLLRPYVTETDTLIDDARTALAASPRTPPADHTATEREREEQRAQAALDAASAARREARAELRMLWRQRQKMSTAELSPDQAAAVDLIREREAELVELRSAVVVMETEVSNRVTTNRAPTASSLHALFDRYAASGAANPKTVRKWRARLVNLVSFLGHDDANRVTRADLNRWIEELVSKGLAKKTIIDGYLPAVRAALVIAHDDGVIPSNPASALKVRAPKAVKLRERDLTDDEAKTILGACLGPQPAGLAVKHALARRWVPWLCAYTGARVGEITQLRAKDIRQEDGVWVAHITPEAGSVKTYEARSVPLHPHLIEQGILQLANEGDAAPLFHQEGTGNAINPASKIRAADLAKWVRSLGITAPQPNHGWRHRFKTIARSAGIPEYLAERIQGHAPSNAAGKYGFIPLAMLYDAVASIPYYALETKS